MPKGFQLLSDVEVPKRLTVALGGHAGCGKTHFALTAPGPIAYFNLDMNEDRVIKKFVKKKKIYEVKFKRSVLGVKTNYKLLWKKFRDAHIEAISDKSIKTIVWDSGTEVWEIARLAHFGRMAEGSADVPKNTRGRNYGPVNAEMTEMFRTITESDKNFIVLMQLKKEYRNDSETGNYEFSGFTRTPYLVQCVGTIKYDEDEVVEDDDTGYVSGFWIDIEKNTLNPSLKGSILEYPDCDFPSLLEMSHAE